MEDCYDDDDYDDDDDDEDDDDDDDDDAELGIFQDLRIIFARL